jgi:hypothetical protein
VGIETQHHSQAQTQGSKKIFRDLEGTTGEKYCGGKMFRG